MWLNYLLASNVYKDEWKYNIVFLSIESVRTVFKIFSTDWTTLISFAVIL